MASTPPRPPPAPRVSGNQWRDLPVPALGQWTPTRPVTVVVPYYQAPDALERTLAGFAHQSYPTELLQMIVVDDGSSPPLELARTDDLKGLDVQVVHQEDRGFGLARARNTGAATADGEILIFVDCDMVPEPWHVEAHARWHHRAADLVVLGFRRHVDFAGIEAPAIRAADADEGLAPLFDGRDVDVPEWIDGHMRRTDDLTSADDDLFRPVTGGNLSMRADTYARVGGSDETFTQWGAEDTELGYRLFVDGAVLVPDRQAGCWHQGPGQAPSAEERASLEDQRAKLAHLIAHRGFRSGSPGRRFTVPRALVWVPVTADNDRDAVVATVESLLGGSFTDVRVVVSLPPDHPQATWLERQFSPDPTVEVHHGDHDVDALAPFAPVRVVAPPGVVFGTATLARLVAMLESADRPVGVIKLTAPARGSGAPQVLLEAQLTRAARRAARGARDEEDVAALAGHLFGERWVSAGELGVAHPALNRPSPPVPAQGPAPAVPRLAQNAWTALSVPPIGQWTPTRPVTVVIPHYQAPEALATTLAAFTAQTYPVELLQVVVVDDGSSPPLELPDALELKGLHVEVIHQEDRGFGAARARNAGAAAATGEILIFVDCDMVPEPWHVEAHARWHHAASDVVVQGFRGHVDFAGITASMVAAMDPQTGVAPFVAGRPIQEPQWIEGHMLRTNELMSADRDLFRPVTSGNLSVGVEELRRVGGFDETFTQWGGEDTELGYRLFVDGAVLVPDREARCWHQGAGQEPSPSEWVSLENQRSKLAHLVADRGFRSSQRGRFFAVPRVVVRVPVDTNAGRDVVVMTVESILAGDFTDVRLVLQLADDHPDRIWIERQFAPDPHVVVQGPGGLPALDVVAPFAPIRGTVDVGVVFGDRTLSCLVRELDGGEDPVGLVHVTVPGRSPDDANGMIQLWLTRAYRRATRTVEPGEALDAVGGELFGERWVAGTEVGVHDRSVEPPTPRVDERQAVDDPGQLDEISDLWDVFRNLDAAERRVILDGARTGLKVLGPSERAIVVRLVKRVMLLTSAVQGLLAARSPGAVLTAMSRVCEALLPWAVYRPLRQAARPVASRLRSLRT